MNSVKTHYDTLLGPVYSWIVGDFETARDRCRAQFRVLGIESRQGGLAVDLGCGPGCQSIPLAELGYRVVAIDFCQGLLDELESHAADLPVTAVRDDLLNFAEHIDDAPQLIVCMGDTLAHLPDRDSVSRVLESAATTLAPGGTFVASIRDYSGPPPTGADRFVPVRSSEDRIFTCFLDYRDDVIVVHDILQVREAGGWRMEVSDYQKLILDYRPLVAQLGRLGLEVRPPAGSAGMLLIRADKPA